jgi:DNA-binding CsgD family transcriptional regulator
MLTRQEREYTVLNLYNQGRTIRDIAKELRMSFRDIGAILKKEEKEKERQKRQLENNTTPNSDSTRSRMSLSTQAYKLFSQGKTPVEVATELDLSEKKVTKYYKEFWKLKGLYKLNLIHDEIKEDIIDFAKLYRLSKAVGKNAEHVVNLLNIANDDLPTLEGKYIKLQENVDHLESKELDLSITLEHLKSHIQDATQSLDSCRLSYQKEVSKTLQWHKQNTELDRLLTGFKNNNKEYIRIQFVARQTVKSALSDKRQLLKLALFSLIESRRASPTKFNFLVHGMSPLLTTSKSTMMNYAGSRNSQVSPFSSYYIQNGYPENLIELIVNGATSIYEKIVKDFTNETIANTAANTDSNLLHSTTHLDEQTHRLI